MPEHFEREAVFQKCTNVTDPYIYDDTNCVYDPKCLNNSSSADVGLIVVVDVIARILCELRPPGIRRRGPRVHELHREAWRPF